MNAVVLKTRTETARSYQLRPCQTCKMPGPTQDLVKKISENRLVPSGTGYVGPRQLGYKLKYKKTDKMGT